MNVNTLVNVVDADSVTLAGVVVPRLKSITPSDWLLFWNGNELGWPIGRELVTGCGFDDATVCGQVLVRPTWYMNGGDWFCFWIERSEVGAGHLAERKCAT